MQYDDLLRRVGEFGRFQQLQYLLVCIVALTVTLHSFNMVFVGATPKHRCKLLDVPPELENLTETELVTLAIPMTEDGELEKCKMYNLSDFDWTKEELSVWLASGNRSVTDCVHGWQYETDYYYSTIVSDWDLVCENAWRKNLASSIFFAGRLAGSLLGQFADRYGRRPVFFICAILQVIVGCSAAFSPNIWFFYVAYFLQGALAMAVQISCYVLGMEVVGPKYRPLVGLSFNIFRALSQMLLAGVALGIKRWRWIEVTISVVSLLYISYYWLMPESIRWLISAGRDEEASRLLTKVAKMNKVQLEKDILKKIEKPKKQPNSKKITIVDIFKQWITAKLTLMVWFNWMIAALVYYGVSLNTARLAGNPYLNFFVSGGVEIPSLILGIFLLKRFGRKKIYIAYLFLAGAGCLSSAFIPRDLEWLATLLVMFGKFGIAGAYAIIQVVAAEVFPTVIRNVGMSTSSAFARLGAMAAPQIMLLEAVAPYVPLTVFGGLAVVAAGLGLLLKETRGKDLPETFQDMDESLTFNLWGGLSGITIKEILPEPQKPTHTDDSKKDKLERF